MEPNYPLEVWHEVAKECLCDLVVMIERGGDPRQQLDEALRWLEERFEQVRNQFLLARPSRDFKSESVKLHARAAMQRAIHLAGLGERADQVLVLFDQLAGYKRARDLFT